jgi:hypothetical protein
MRTPTVKGKGATVLPALHSGHVDVGRVQLDGVADAAGHLAGDDRRPRSAERLVDSLAGAGVVLDRALHALDGLLGAVAGLGLLRLVDLPDGRLLAVAAQ